MNYKSSRAQLAFLRTGLTEEDMQHPTLNELQLLHPEAVAQTYFQAKKQLAEQNKQTFAQAVTEVEKGLTYAEFAVLGEPDSLAHLVVDKQQFASKFQVQPDEKVIHETDTRMEVVLSQSEQLTREKAQRLDERQGQFQNSRAQLEQQIRQQRELKARTLDAQLRGICDRAQQVQREMAYDGKRTFAMLRQAEEKRAEQQRAQTERQRRMVEELETKARSMREATERQNQQFIQQARELQAQVDRKALQCQQFKALQAENEIQKQKQRDAARLEVLGSSQRLQAAYNASRAQDANDIMRKHEDLVQQTQQERMLKTAQLAQTTAQLLTEKQRARSQLYEQRSQQAKDRLGSYQSKEQNAASERQTKQQEVQREHVARALRAEQIRRQIAVKKRQEDFQLQLRSVGLIGDKSKFSKLNV